jgi:membrane protease YdiL (CAAX protease family)
MTTTVPAPRTAVAVALGGCAVLMLRPVLVTHLSHPAAVLAVVFIAIATVGLTWPGQLPRLSGREVRIADFTTRKSVGVVVPLLVGVGAFAVGRIVGGGHPPTAQVGVALLGNTLAAVAEEAFFRRFLYGLLASKGDAVAVAGTAIAFAAVHITVYGVWVLPIDLAAGAVLSWQRWATGSWAVPAITHVLANVLVVM